jgi:hypothetical protein
MNRSILHLIRTLNPERGGPVTFVKEISAAHAAMGVKVSILTLEPNHASWVAGLPVSTIECAGRGTYGYASDLEAKIMGIAPSFEAIVVNGLWQFHGLNHILPQARYRVGILPLGVPKTTVNADRSRETFLREFPHLQGRQFLLFLGRLYPKKGCVFVAIVQEEPSLDSVRTNGSRWPFVLRHPLRRLGLVGNELDRVTLV